jgi:hypothetical protein
MILNFFFIVQNYFLIKIKLSYVKGYWSLGFLSYLVSFVWKTLRGSRKKII